MARAKRQPNDDKHAATRATPSLGDAAPAHANAEAEQAGTSATSPEPAAMSDGQSLTPEGFAQAFNERVRVFWWIAVGVVSDRSTAEDVVQEAALQALQKLEQFTVGTDFTAWMGQIVRYIALNHARKRSRRNTVPMEHDAMEAYRFEGEAPVQVGAGATADEQARSLALAEQLPDDQPWFDDRVVEALHAVPATARACLLLRTLEGLPYEEISALLDIPPGTAMSHVHRTRHALRRSLSHLSPKRTANLPVNASGAASSRQADQASSDGVSRVTDDPQRTGKPLNETKEPAGTSTRESN